jgi:hypothetical protein
MLEKIEHRDALHLFACHLEWRTKRNPVRVPGTPWRRSTITTTTFAALQNLSCTEARQGLSELRPLSNPGEGAAVPSRKTSGKLFAILWTGAQWQYRR